MEKINLRPDGTATLTPYLLPGEEERPAVLVIPGGGYSCVCEDTEGWPIARRFNALGFHAGVLEYRVAPARFPAPQQDALSAMRLLRARAADWHIIPDNIAVCGFSAGGHLAASIGVIPGDVAADPESLFPDGDGRPNALILAYGVLSFAEWSHQGTVQSLLGDSAAGRELMSLEKRIDGATPPAFVWHTFPDRVVPYRNSIVFAEAMTAAGRPCEVHLFSTGDHGTQLGYGRDDIAQWPALAKTFLRETCGFRFPEKLSRRTVVLTFDDACKSQIAHAVPVLQNYGFGATFFICRFSDEWRAAHSAELLTAAEIKQLADAGFGIGNHTWSHPDLRECPPEKIEEEIGRLNTFLQEAGVPAPACFAYPGGPYAGNAVEILKKFGFRCARSVADRGWDIIHDDPMNIPATALQQDDWQSFYQAVSRAGGERAPVLVFHGIPDTVHPWCSNSPEFFAKCMRYLRDNGYQVVGLDSLV